MLLKRQSPRTATPAQLVDTVQPARQDACPDSSSTQNVVLAARSTSRYALDLLSRPADLHSVQASSLLVHSNTAASAPSTPHQGGFGMDHEIAALTIQLFWRSSRARRRQRQAAGELLRVPILTLAS